MHAHIPLTSRRTNVQKERNLKSKYKKLDDMTTDEYHHKIAL